MRIVLLITGIILLVALASYAFTKKIMGLTFLPWQFYWFMPKEYQNHVKRTSFRAIRNIITILICIVIITAILIFHG